MTKGSLNLIIADGIPITCKYIVINLIASYDKLKLYNNLES